MNCHKNATIILKNSLIQSVIEELYSEKEYKSLDNTLKQKNKVKALWTLLVLLIFLSNENDDSRKYY